MGEARRRGKKRPKVTAPWENVSDADISDSELQRIEQEYEEKSQRPVTPSVLEEPEVKAATEADEFAGHFCGSEALKLVITTGPGNEHVGRATHNFLDNFVGLFPEARYVARKSATMTELLAAARDAKVTSMVVISQRGRKPHKMHFMKLPEGPCVSFRITGYMAANKLEGRGQFVDYAPELVFKNFDLNVLSARVQRCLASVLPVTPEYEGRRAVVFHNERDFIFFRHYVYVFSEGGKKVRLEEVGPRFTLKLRNYRKQLPDDLEKIYEFSWMPKSQVKDNAYFMSREEDKELKGGLPQNVKLRASALKKRLRKLEDT